MESDDELYKAFLEEMHALENFRLTYVADHKAAALDREDPDVRRLMEALAFFAARTYRAGMRNISRTHLRIVRQFLPYLLAPMPAMGVVQAVPNGRFADAILLPAGEELGFSPDRQRVAMFRTLRDLRVLPLALGRVSTVIGPSGAPRLLIPMSAPHARNEEIGTLGVYINYLNDYLASLRLHRALRLHARRFSVSFDPRVDEATVGEPCKVTFGLHGESDEEAAAQAWGHPIQRERAFFHCPEADLYVNVTFPAPPRNWRAFTLCVDLAPEWPANLRLSKEAFQLFTTPVVNLQSSVAQPIVHDATQDVWPIRHMSASGGFELNSVLGVTRIKDGAMATLRSATLAGGAGSYELVEGTLARGQRSYALQLHLPDDFEEPSTISVDCEWTQPWFSESVGKKLRIAPYRRSSVGIDWELPVDLVGQREAAATASANEFTNIVVLQNKARLNFEDFLALFDVLGTVWTRSFAPLRELLRDVRVKEVPLQLSGGASGVKLVYTLELKAFEESRRPLVEVFATHAQAVLDAWISEAPVEVRIAEPAK